MAKETTKQKISENDIYMTRAFSNIYSSKKREGRDRKKKKKKKKTSNEVNDRQDSDNNNKQKVVKNPTFFEKVKPCRQMPNSESGSNFLYSLLRPFGSPYHPLAGPPMASGLALVSCRRFFSATEQSHLNDAGAGDYQSSNSFKGVPIDWNV